MGTMELILTSIGLILVLLGVFLIFDARFITKKFFSFGDQNEGTLGIKIAGIVILIISAGLIIFI